jgi:hypothetical protein
MAARYFLSPIVSAHFVGETTLEFALPRFCKECDDPFVDEADFSVVNDYELAQFIGEPWDTGGKS